MEGRHHVAREGEQLIFLLSLIESCTLVTRSCERLAPNPWELEMPNSSKCLNVFNVVRLPIHDLFESHG